MGLLGAALCYPGCWGDLEAKLDFPRIVLYRHSVCSHTCQGPQSLFPHRGGTRGQSAGQEFSQLGLGATPEVEGLRCSGNVEEERWERTSLCEQQEQQQQQQIVPQGKWLDSGTQRNV